MSFAAPGLPNIFASSSRLMPLEARDLRKSRCYDMIIDRAAHIDDLK
jgi:hypothetical protein